MIQNLSMLLNHGFQYNSGEIISNSTNQWQLLDPDGDGIPPPNPQMSSPKAHLANSNYLEAKPKLYK